MSDFEKSIYELVPEIHDEAQIRSAAWLVSEQERLAHEAARLQAKQEAILRSREIGQQALHMLIEHKVPDVGIIASRRSGYVHEVGRGWHIYSHYTPSTEGYRGTNENIGLNSRGEILTTTQLRIKVSSVEWQGLINPITIGDSEARLRIAESAHFKKGLASLISGYGPRHSQD